MQLYVITDTSVQNRFSHLELARMALLGGADFIQLREKRMATGELLQLAMAMSRLCKNGRVPFLVNDRVDIALMSGADGVHLGEEDFPIQKAREILGPGKLVGATASTVETAREKLQEGASYVGVGHIFHTSSKAKLTPPLGIEILKTISEKVRIPVVAIGGIHCSNIGEVVKARPFAVAVLSAVACADDPFNATRTLKNSVFSSKTLAPHLLADCSQADSPACSFRSRLQFNGDKP